MARFYLKHRDTRPVLAPVLHDPDGSIHDLTGAAKIYLHIKLESGTKLTAREMTPPGDLKTGQPTYTWLAADWTTGKLVAGNHQMEYEVLGPGVARLTFPNAPTDNVPKAAYDDLIIAEDIGQGA